MATTIRPELKEEIGIRSLVPNARHLSISQVVRRLFRVAVLFLAARLLGVENFGAYALLLTVIEMAALVSGFGYVDYLTREIAKEPNAGWPLGVKVMQVRLAYIVPVVAVALVLLDVLRFPSGLLSNVALLSVTLIPRAAGETAQGVMKGLRRFGLLPWIEFVQGGIVLAVAPPLLFYGFGVRGIIFAEILAATGGAVVSVLGIAQHVNVRSSDHRSLREVMHSTLVFNVYPFIVNVYDRVDVVLLSKLAGNFATGIYSLPYRVFATFQIIPYSILGAMLPVFSASAVNQDSRRKCSRIMEFLYITALLIVLVTLAFARPAVLFLLGPSYTGSILTMKILVWATVPTFLNYALNTLLLAAHREQFFLSTATVCTVFNISANLLLIPRFTFLAAAAVTVMTELLLLAQNFYLVKRLLGHPVVPEDGAKITLVFAAICACFVIFQHWVSEIAAGSLACSAFAAYALRMSSDYWNSLKGRGIVGQQL